MIGIYLIAMEVQLPLVIATGVYYIKHIAHSCSNRHVRHGHLNGVLAFAGVTLLQLLLRSLDLRDDGNEKYIKFYIYICNLFIIG